MQLIMTPEADEGWAFTVKMTKEDFESLTRAEQAVLFDPASLGVEKQPTSNLLRILAGFARRLERQKREA